MHELGLLTAKGTPVGQNLVLEKLTSGRVSWPGRELRDSWGRSLWDSPVPWTLGHSVPPLLLVLLTSSLCPEVSRCFYHS